MSGDDIRAFAQSFLEEFARGDVIACANRLDEHIEWFLHAPITVFPFAGARRGRGAVLAAIAELVKDYRLERQRTEFVIVDQDRSAVLADISLTQRSTDRLVRLRVVNLSRYRHGRLCEYHGFADSFDAVEQALGGWLDLTRTTPREPDLLR